MVKKRRTRSAVKRPASPETESDTGEDLPALNASPRKRDKLDRVTGVNEISERNSRAKETDELKRFSMEAILDEPKIFLGLPAWFSSSVAENRKKSWVENGGRVADLDEACFVFSEDRNADDTKVIYKTEKFLSETLSVFHALYVDDCISAGSMKSVVIGFYILPPEEVYTSLKELKSTESICCLYKWEAVECAACSMLPFPKKTSTGEALNHSDCLGFQQDVFGYVDLDSLPEPDCEDVEEFVVGVNGAELFLQGS